MERWGRMRAQYAASGLSEEDLLPDPTAMFERWMDDVIAAELPEPNAMVLSTVSEQGVPSSRTVLLKGLDHWGFRFFTNLSSRKGVDLAANPACALLFPWHPIERQVRVEGVASQMLRQDVAAYFVERPRGSRLGAWASQQSARVADRAEIDRAFAAVSERFPEPGEVPVPTQWGGYVVRPEVVEFWQGRRDRLHDRLVYRRNPDGDGWTVVRLYP